MTFLLNYTKYTAIKGVRNCETAPKLCGDFFTLTVFWSPKGILVIDKVPFCVVLVKLSQKSVYWCLRQPVAFFFLGQISLSCHTPKCLCVQMCSWRENKVFCGWGQVDRTLMLLMSQSWRAPSVGLWLLLYISVSLTHYATMPSATPGHQSPHPVKGLLWQSPAVWQAWCGMKKMTHIISKAQF